MSKTFEKEFRRKATPLLARRGLAVGAMESGLDDGSDDEIAFLDAEGRKALVELQVSNADSHGSYVVVGVSGMTTRRLASGWSFSALGSVTHLPARPKTDVDGILAEVLRGLEETAYATDPASGPDPKAVDHPLLLPVIDVLSGFDDVGIAGFRVADTQGILAVRGTDTLRFEAAPGEISIAADGGARTVVRNRFGSDAFAAAIHEAAVEHLGVSPLPALR